MEFNVKKYQTVCPFCGKTTLSFKLLEKEVAYLGRIAIFSSVCSFCGFKHNDVFCLEVKEPVKFVLKVESEEDLMCRVVRSSSGTIIIPELGVKIEPGPKCQGFITNVEGILRRIEDVLIAQEKVLKGKRLEKVKELLKKISLMIEGKLPFKLIIKDPLGNSAILSEKAKRKKLTKREMQKLKVGLSFLF